MNKFDQFCRKYERYGVKNLMTIIVAGQAVMGLLCLLLSTSNPIGLLSVMDALSFRPDAFLQGQIWRLVTFLFVPESLFPLSSGLNLIWFILSLLFYFWVGRTLEAEWGRMKFTVYYVSGALMAVIFSLFTNAMASQFYLNLSLFFALATLMPDRQIRLYLVIPIKMKYIALVQAAIFIVLPFFSWPLRLDNLFPTLSVLNYLIFFWKPLWALLRRTPGNIRHSQRTVKFKSEVKRAKSHRGYIHKCAVCGRTDTEKPDMEFRYCSLCAGYACYCADHIFNHPHKTG